MDDFFDNQTGLDPMTPAKVDYRVDIAMLIDATGSMKPIIDEVKANALNFYKTFHNAMDAAGKQVDQLRIKVIPFRDYKYDGSQSMADSGFFVLPEQNAEFEAYVQGIEAAGGGDEPENALEAIALAMNSDWVMEGSKRRHVILVYTDASALPLKEAERVASSYYPANMPNNLVELNDMWNGIGQYGMPEQRSKRLVLFAPSAKPWADMEGVWDSSWITYSKAGAGLREVDTDLAISLLVQSMD